MKKKIFLVFFIVIFLIFCFFSFVFIEYIYTQRTNKNMITYCSQNNTDECYRRMFELMLPKLLFFNAKVKSSSSDIDLIWFDTDTVRVDSLDALNSSDALLGYGVYHTTEYEDEFSRIFDKNAYAFDCGVSSFQTKSPKCKFYSECLASDDFLIWDIFFTREMQKSSGKVHLLSDKLKELGLKDKNVFVKIDVDEGDISVLPEIIKNSDNITGFNIALHVRDAKAIIDRLPILDKINEKYVLVARHTMSQFHNHTARDIKSKYYNGIINSRIIYLSYINKKLLSEYEVSLVQNTDVYYNKKLKNLGEMHLSSEKLIPLSDIHYVLPLVVKSHSLFGGER